VRIVVKVGTSIITLPGKDGLDHERIGRIARGVAEVRALGHEVILVSSGAIGAGMGSLGWKTRPRDLRAKQAAAAVGQVALMQAYEKALKAHDLSVAQVLLTSLDLEDRIRYVNARNTLLTLLSMSVVPVINENDTVVTDEIQFGDNDTLSALVAVKVEADLLVILTNVDGFYRKGEGPDAGPELVKEINLVSKELEKEARSEASSELSVGGMRSKLAAARTAMASGVDMWIANGQTPGILSAIVRGTAEGTRFVAKRSKLGTRKRWIAFGARSKGQLTVDEGAARALAQKGKSLLPSGVITVTGRFQAGSAVSILDASGREVGRGLSNYSSEEIRLIRGHKSGEIPKILGRAAAPEIVHRDNLVVL
jgi:glutamate 5-kinase